jgi:Uma2 family endonuclease
MMEENGAATVIFAGGQVSLPRGLTDIHAFRHWAESDDFPTEGRIWWLTGRVWIDMSGEQIFTHVLIKSQVTAVLVPLGEANDRGIYLTDGALLSNVDADISGKPDGMFISNKTLESDRIRLIEGKESGFVEVEGSPDMVLEIVSDSSVQKDTVVLKKAYWEAGIPEYWLVDAREEPLRFDIFRHTARGYVAVRKQQGWVRSSVFGKTFRLVQRITQARHPAYKLEVR